MQTNLQQGRFFPERPGLKPAGYVIDLKRGKKAAPLPLETVVVSCGLCQFQFERTTKPVQMLLICPSCGVRFEHRMPEPERQMQKTPKNECDAFFSTPPKRRETILSSSMTRQPVSSQPIERMPEPSALEPLQAEPVCIASAETEEIWDRILSDSGIVEEPEKDLETVAELWTTEQDGRWATTLITVAQSILIVAALIGLISGTASFFEEKANSVAKAPLGILGKSYDDIFVEKSVVVDVKTPTASELIPLPDIDDIPSIPVANPGVNTTAIAKSQPVTESGLDDLPLFDVAEHLRNDGKETLVKDSGNATDTVQESSNRTNEANAPNVSTVPASTVPGVLHEDPLQIKLAETEQKVQALEQRYKQSLREQGQIQAQSKKLVSETLLRESAITLEKNPTRSLFLSLKSVQMFNELGQQVSDWGKTILARSYAAQTPGENFVERIPRVETQSISTNGKWLLTANSDQSLWIWDISKCGSEDAKELGFRIDVCPVPIVDILLTPDEHWVVGARSDGLVEMWNMAVDRPSEATIVFGDRIPGLCRLEISPDGRWLVAYGNPFTEHQARQTFANGDELPQDDLSQPNFVGAEEKQNDEKNVIQTVSLQTEMLRSVANGGNPIDWNGVWMWDLNVFKQGTGIPKAIVLRGHERPIRCLAISPDSRWLATGSEDRSVRVFDLKSTYPGGNQKVLLGHQLEITDLQFAGGGQWIATGSRDNTIRIWDLQGETATPTARVLKGHNGWISSLAVSANGKWFATAGYDQAVRIWNTQSFLSADPEKESFALAPEQGTVQTVAFTPDSTILVTYGANRSIKLWNLASEAITENVVVLDREIKDFSFGENGRWLILSCDQGNQTSLSLWPLKFDDLVKQATRFTQTALPIEMQQREDTYAKQFEQRIVR